MYKLVATSALALSLTACGSSDNNAIEQTDDANTVTLPSVLIGQVTKVTADSLMVNQQLVSARNADIELDGQNSSLTAIKVGMMVEVETNGREATEIDYDPRFKGPITFSDNNASIAGVSVVGLDKSNINSGQLLELSGYHSAYNEFTVTYQQPLSDNTELELEGVISNYQPANNTFLLGDIIVNFQQAELDGVLKNGHFVEVEGFMSNQQLLASEIDAQPNAQFDDNIDTELSGKVTFINNDASLLTLNSQWQIKITDSTRFEDITRTQLQVGDIIEVDATWQQANSWFLAQLIELEKSHTGTLPQSHFSVSGLAEINDSIVRINNIEFKLNNHTVFDDGLSVASANGLWLELEGTIVNSSYIINEIELMDSNEPLNLTGMVSNNSQQTASIFGYTSEDNSLEKFSVQYVELECQWVAAQQMRNCQLDN